MFCAPRSATPSPKWPTRSIARRSTTVRADEEFDVAVAPRDPRRKNRDAGASERGREGRDVVADFLMHHRVADDAAFGMLSRRFELRFYQCEQMHPSGRH